MKTYFIKPVCHSNLPHLLCIDSSSLSVLHSLPRRATRSLLFGTFPVLSIPFHLPMLKRAFVFQSQVGRVRLSFSDGLWKGSDSAWKENSKGNLCDISRHVNRQSSEQGLTRQLLAANPMADKVFGAESNKGGCSIPQWTLVQCCYTRPCFQASYNGPAVNYCDVVDSWCELCEVDQAVGVYEATQTRRHALQGFLDKMLEPSWPREMAILRLLVFH